MELSADFVLAEIVLHHQELKWLAVLSQSYRFQFSLSLVQLSSFNAMQSTYEFQIRPLT